MPNELERGKKSCIAKTRRILTDDKQTDAAKFAEILFARAAAEDLVEYAPASLAAIAQSAFAFFRQKRSGTAVRIADVAEPDVKGRMMTAIEIATTDRPFILESVLGELQADGQAVKLVLHPILAVDRRNGRLVDFADARAGEGGEQDRESFVHIHVPLIRDAETAKALRGRLETLMSEVEIVTEDWAAMRSRLRSAIADLRADPPSIARRDLDETLAFLEWLEDGNFVLFGMREYAYRQKGSGPIEDAGGEGLGLLADPKVKVLRRGSALVTMTPEIQAFLLAPEPLIVTKANVKSRVHRRDYMDYVGIKFFRKGRVAGELRVVGLFTASSFNQSVQRIPLIRTKVATILERAGFDPASHSGKTLLNVLENYPRTELFQADVETLYDSAMAILQLHERPRIRVLARRDRFDRFVSILVFAPRDRYSSDVREAIGARLAELYCGRVSAFFPSFSESSLVRVQFIIGRSPEARPEPTQAELEAAIGDIVRTFEDELAEVIAAAEPERATELTRRYARAFGSDYRGAFDADTALRDIVVAERLDARGIEAEFRQRDATQGSQVMLRFHHIGTPIPLSRRVPLLENLGFSVINERTYRLTPEGGSFLYIHDMTLATSDAAPVNLRKASKRLRGAILAAWDGSIENDGFNALVLLAGLHWREAELLRTIGRYLRQTDIPYSIDYMWAVLQRYPRIAALLVERFCARFAPDVGDRERAEKGVERRLGAALDAVENIDDDTILRAFRDVIRASVRTDYYALDEKGAPHSGVTIKLEPRRLSFVPAPRPYREIFVHGPLVEGVHMRFGPVARGGLRWSDRPQDYRVEVLGLVKAQQVKNAVIVPVGAKGGFVPLRMPSSPTRDAAYEAGRQAYIAFVDRLLSVTDDLEEGEIVPPTCVVRHDGDDPYLVVAADKGTATFSDTANSISEAHSFWLGDAFASGGSAGYDHKVMGITARGAWEAVKRHFREMDKDIQSEPFTVAGVGDMSGDVFGNGMLLSRCIRLQAAFDHRDIFIDPSPDPAASFAERERLFALPRSSWQDYDKTLISKGGGVFSRKEKQIPVSPEMRKLLKLKKSAARPAEIMSAILRMNVELLWFGGIGTYVRAADESDQEVGDKANDAIRIMAAELGAAVVGEGANLGMTQKARIAYGLRGGRCNSDAIDNSGGVNSSDLEVNIKIALAPAVRGGRLAVVRRNSLLKSMTEEVAALVLRNNYQQTLAISLEARRGLEAMPNQARLMNELEGQGLLDRKVETLPDEVALAERATAHQPLTRAEIGTLLAYGKIALFNDLVTSGVPDDPYLARELACYFPERMRAKYAEDIERHRLRREIIATQLSNSLINRGGPTLLVAMRDRTGAGAAALTWAYAAVRDSFGLQALHGEIDALDNRAAGGLQLEIYARVQDVLVDRLGWFLRNVDREAGLADIVAHYKSSIEALEAMIPGLLTRSMKRAATEVEARYRAGHVPAELATRLATLPFLARATDVILLADGTKRSLPDAAAAYFAMGERFGFGRLDAMLVGIETADYYEGLALQKARDSLEAGHRDLARALLVSSPNGLDLAGWETASAGRVDAAAQQIERILSDGRASTAKLTVAASLVSELARKG